MAESCNISMSEYNEAQIGKMNNEITDYLAYCKKVEPLLMIIFGTAIRDSGRAAELTMRSYKGFANNLCEYE